MATIPIEVIKRLPEDLARAEVLAGEGKAAEVLAIYRESAGAFEKLDTFADMVMKLYSDKHGAKLLELETVKAFERIALELTGLLRQVLAGAVEKP